MELILSVSIVLFYFSLAGIILIIGQRAVRRAIARGAFTNFFRKKSEPQQTATAVVLSEMAAEPESLTILNEPTLFSAESQIEKIEIASEQVPEEEEVPHIEDDIGTLIHDPMQDVEPVFSHDEPVAEPEVQQESFFEQPEESDKTEVKSELTPQKIILLLRRAEALIARKDFDEAKKILIHILSWEEDNFDASAHLAYVYLQSGEYRKAENLFLKALELRPRDPSLLSNYALAILEQKDPARITDSVEAFRLAAKLDPANPDRYANLGQSLFFAGDIPNAIAAFEKAAKLAPRKIEYYFFLADSYLTVRNYIDAKRVFEKILDLSPLNEDAKREMSTLQRMGF